MNPEKFYALFGNDRNLMAFFGNGAKQVCWDSLKAVMSFKLGDVRMWEKEESK